MWWFDNKHLVDILRNAFDRLDPTHGSLVYIWFFFSSFFPQVEMETISVSDGYSLCNITTRPIIPSMAVFIQGCSDSMIVTYPTNGMYPTANTTD